MAPLVLLDRGSKLEDAKEATEYLFPEVRLAKLIHDWRTFELRFESRGEGVVGIPRANEKGLGEKECGITPDWRWNSIISSRVALAPRGRKRVFSGMGIVSSRSFLEKPPACVLTTNKKVGIVRLVFKFQQKHALQ